MITVLCLVQMREQLSERLDHLLASVHKSSGGESGADASSQVAEMVDGIEAREESDCEGQPPRRIALPIATVDLSSAREAECSGVVAAAAAVALAQVQVQAQNGHAEQCE